MKRSKKFKLDYARLSDSDDLVFLCLPLWLQKTMLDLTGRFLWSRTWETSSGEYPVLTEADIDKIEYAIWQLTLEECDMVINVTTGSNTQQVNGGCGCGCGGNGGTQAPAPPTTDDYPPDPIPPVPTPEDETGLLWKCNMSHYCASVWRELGMMAADLRTSDIMQRTENVHLNLGVTPPSYASRLAYSTAAVFFMGGTTSAIVSDVMGQHYDAAVCAIYAAPTAAAALDNLRELGRQSFSFGAGTDYLALLLPLETAFVPQATNDNLPPTFRNKTCVICGETDPSVPGEWEYEDIYVSGNSTHTFDSPDGTEFAQTGYYEAGTTTDTRYAVSKPVIDGNEIILATWSAVSFTLTTSMETITPTTALYYGAINHQIQLVDYFADGGVTTTKFVVKRTGEPTPAGTWDVVVEVADLLKLSPRFTVSAYTYHPEPWEDVSLEVEGYTVYLA